MSDTILILTNESDAHADLMVQVIERRGVPVVRFDPGDIPRKARLSWKLGAEPQSLITTNSRTIDLDRVKTVWLRRPTPWEALPSTNDDVGHSSSGDLEGQFIKAERDQAVAGLWMNMDAFWVNDPTSERRANIKPYQLRLASQLGFDVPATLLTNDPSEALLFYDKCQGDMIYKTLSSSGPQYLQRMVYTSPVVEAHLRLIERVRVTPCLFQKNIPKLFEVRTTVVGQRTFSAAIYSQENEETRHDWRSGGTELRMEPYDLPMDVSKMITKLTSALDLVYGAIDMIVTPEGEHVFLEINPSGQFGFVEQLTGLPILSCLADALVAGGTC